MAAGSRTAFILTVSDRGSSGDRADTSGDGLSDSDKVLLGLNPLAVNPVIPVNLNIQTCPQ